MDLDGQERFHVIHLRSKDIRDCCSNMHNDYFELVLRGDFDRNKNYLEENQGFVNCQQNLNLAGVCISPFFAVSQLCRVNTIEKFNHRVF